MFRLKVVTPHRMFFEAAVKTLVIRGIEGDLAIMKGTTPLLTPTKISVCTLHLEDGSKKEAALGRGYIAVDQNGATLVVESAEWPEDIDLERAHKAKERAEAYLQAKDKQIDYERAKIALAKAINRINAANKK
ncbi:MAG: ATP synthase F1 subunit epsilon [Eubacteriales bacterium]|nr:ATP synthase F1 subunit epsilon [Eubacteriales bacterium]